MSSRVLGFGIVGQGGRAVDGIGELGDPVKGIRRIEGLRAERVGDIANTSRRIQNPLGFPIEWVFTLTKSPTS
jgi:hypothetical protein